MSGTQDRRAPNRVLIVEIHEIVARECASTLKRVERIETKWVSGEATALERVEDWNPQLLIVGDDMSGRNGPDLCKEIRNRSTVPIIVVTSWPDNSHMIRCLNSGADDCIPYPFEPPLFLARVLALMRRAYRYSVPPQHTQPSHSALGALQFQQSGPPRMVSSATWPRCQACGYLGPSEKFDHQEGKKIVSKCPACGERIRIVRPLA